MGALLLLGLAACGGGGDSTPAPAAPAPSITAQPANATVADGASHTFTVTATGSGLGYQWRKDGAEISGATAASLEVTAFHADNNAKYSVVVTNPQGSVTSAEATLAVTPVLPTISGQPASLSVRTGLPANFSVVAAGTAPLAYQWLRNGTAIPGATAATYTLNPTALGDNGAVFSVTVTNPAGNVTSSGAILTVSDTAAVAPLAVATPPQAVSAVVGGTAQFSVVASGGTAPYTYQWQRNGTNVAGAIGASHTTPALALGDSGAQYRVVVTDAAAASVTSPPAALTVVGSATSVLSIGAGELHSLAVKADGSVWTWGYWAYLGIGNTITAKGALAQVKNADGTNFTGALQGSAGGAHSVVVKTDGTVWTWGTNLRGQLGDGTTTERRNPVQVKDATGVPLTGVIAVSAGGDGSNSFTLALKGDGTVWSWGYNVYGQLGNNATINSASPVPVRDASGAPLSNVKKISAGQYHAVALKHDGTVWAWGRANSGQIGNGTNTGQTTSARQVEASAGVGLVGAVDVGAGLGHSVAVLADGTAYAWGTNTAGTLGDGTTISRTYATLVKNTAGTAVTNIKAAAAGSGYTVFVLGDGKVLASGSNANGLLGDGTTANRINPVAVKNADGSEFAGASPVPGAVVALHIHTIVRKADGGVWAWGSNNQGQTGQGTGNFNTSPVQVAVSGI